MDSATAVQNILAHHGIKGMRWGVRKGHSRSSGPEDVSVKTDTGPTGKASVKTSGGSGHPPHPDSVAARVVQQKLAKSGSHALSNEEIQNLLTRTDLERRLTQVPEPKTGYGHAVKQVNSFLKSPHGQLAVNAAKNQTKSKHIRTVAKVAQALS